MIWAIWWVSLQVFYHSCLLFSSFAGGNGAMDSVPNFLLGRPDRTESQEDMWLVGKVVHQLDYFFIVQPWFKNVWTLCKTNTSLTECDKSFLTQTVKQYRDNIVNFINCCKYVLILNVMPAPGLKQGGSGATNDWESCGNAQKHLLGTFLPESCKWWHSVFINGIGVVDFHTAVSLEAAEYLLISPPHSFRTQTFAYPESHAEREEILQGLQGRIEDIKSVSVIHVSKSTEHSCTHQDVPSPSSHLKIE